MYENTTMRSAAGRLNLWLLMVILLTLSPLATRAQSSYLTTCNPRENRADFDGDCKTDISTFNRSTGYWTSLNSSTNTYVDFNFGQSGDIATPGDFNGDGKTDRAVFRPGSPSYCYIETDITTPTVFDSVQFGQSGDIPVARDYDGDNKADVAVFRPGSGFWYIRKSSSNPTWSSNIWISVQWGQTGDRVVPDDGDGKADVVVQRPYESERWYILKSAGGTSADPFVNPEFPVPGGYLTPLY